MIPEFDENGNLPPGIYWASWEEILNKFGYTEHRRKLIDGLHKGITALSEVGCKEIYIDGSFVCN